LVLCLPVNLVIYLGTGTLAAYLADRGGNSGEDPVKLGAVAGLLSWVLHAVSTIVLGLIFGFATLGFGFIGMVGWLICGPLIVVVQAGLGAAGGALYRNFWGRRAEQSV